MQFFKLKHISVVCPECETIFATMELARTPEITRDTPIEADLHRVLPDPELRAALLATCPNCIHTWWVSAFAAHYYLPQVVADSPPLQPAKKFAHAVQTGRKHNVHALDRAVLALNGYWCSREEGLDDLKFLKLAKVELLTALNDPGWVGNRSRYNYIMGEVLRLLGEAREAVRYFEKVDRNAQLPAELLEKMRSFAASGNKNPIRLPPHIVEEIFVPRNAASA